MKIGDLIRELRKFNNLSQQTVADKINISRSVLSQYENNLVEPTAYVVAKLAEFFDVSADYLLGLEDETGARAAAPITPSSDPDEQKLVNVYRTLDDDTKAALWTLLNTWTPTTFSGAAQKKRIK